MRDKYFRLQTLGRIALVDPAGEADPSLNKRRQKLALLAVLAMAKRPYTRDQLIELFWGEQEEERARHSLSDALSHLRRALGREAISTRQAEVELSPTAPLRVDAVELSEAFTDKRFERVLELYEGPFLDGIYVASSGSFEHWVTRERARLEPMFLQACEAQCNALARTRRWDECRGVAERWLDVSPMSANAALFLLNAIKAPGTRESDLAAQSAYRALAARLERDHGVAPERTVRALADDIALRLSSTPVMGVPAAALPATALPAAGAGERATAAAVNPPPALPTSPSPAAARNGATDQTGDDPAPPVAVEASTPRVLITSTSEHTVVPMPATTEEWRALRDTRGGRGAPRPAAPIAPPVAPAAASARSWRRPSAWLAGIAVLVISAVAGVRAIRGREGAPAYRVPAVAVMAIRTPAGDSAIGWLRDGLPQMLASKLMRAGTVELIAPERVREVKARAGVREGSEPPLDRLLDLGRRVGATWIVSGALSRGDSTYMLDVNIHDVRDGKLVRLSVVRDRDVLALAEAAAVRVLEAAGASAPGPSLADVETGSVEAYQHYVRALRANSEGRGDVLQRELDAAIALDSGFISAVRLRLSIAQAVSDPVVTASLVKVFERHKSRASAWDLAHQRVLDAFYSGEHQQARELGRALVREFPREPRAYQTLADIYGHHGLWDDAAQVLRQELALDSLAAEAGSGPCAPCVAYRGLFDQMFAQGKLDDAEQVARRWSALQPELPTPWFMLSDVESSRGRFEAALRAETRASTLAGGTDRQRLARMALMRRDWETADSLAAVLMRDARPAYRSQGLDVRMMLDRERGRYRAAATAARTGWREFPEAGLWPLMLTNTLARLGEYEEAARVIEGITHPGPDVPALVNVRQRAWSARGFTWHHALLADAIAPAGDTARLNAIADSIDMVAPLSYYGRDWRVVKHVRGLVAARGGRLEQAIALFEGARWGRAGWTRTNVEMARAYLALGRAPQAIAVLRDAYTTAPEAMGRYAPRTELDYTMALAFARAGEADSAAVYADHVRTAWRESDPELQALLLALDRAVPAR